MVRDGWKFTAPPFAGGTEPAAFFAGVPQEEALARLEWLVEERQRLALVAGAEGCGKSHLLAMLPRRLGGMGCEVALLSLAGLPGEQWIDLLLDRFPLDPATRVEPTRPWQKLEDRLRENTLMERTTVVVCDDADRAPADALEGLTRLATAPEARHARTLVVLAATPAGMSRLPAALVRRAAVRIELAPWDDRDVASFIAAALERVKGDPALFTPAAVDTIARFTAGVPALVVRLARLVLVAGAAEGVERIDAAAVERAWRELLPGDPVRDPPEREAAEDAPPPAPRVRVVRRLGD